MSFAGYLLLVLLPLAAIAWLVWDYKRKTAARSLESASRLEELLTTAHKAEESRAPEAAPTAQQSRTEAASGAALHVSRERLLTPPQTLLYYLLKTGLPDHLVFAHVSLASLVDAGPGLSGLAREESIRKSAELTVDFVVTDKNTRPIAVVDLDDARAEGARAADRVSVRTRLAAAGVRYLELEATKLPRKEAMRPLVLGESSASELIGSPPQRIAS